MPRHMALDGYSLNEKIDRIKSQVEAELDEFEARFEDLYNLMNEIKQEKKAPKKKAKKQKASADV